MTFLAVFVPLKLRNHAKNGKLQVNEDLNTNILEISAEKHSLKHDKLKIAK